LPLDWPLLAGARDASVVAAMFSEESSGTVVSFDEHRGDGYLRTDDGRELWFHCTAIADGTRKIDQGTKVRFAIQPGLPGQWEAARVTPA
jgi:cold shock CspA family protein